MAKKVIQITVNAKQASQILKRFDTQFKSVNRSVNQSNKYLSRFQGTMAAVFSFQALRAVGSWSDQMKQLSTRINTFKKEGENAALTQKKLFEIQRANGLGLNTMVDGYTKISSALKDTTYSSQTTLDVFESASLAFRVFGVNAQQADSALLQLTQGLASGRLAGDEFKSVAENASVLLDFFAKELGVSRGQLKELAAQGRITGEVIVNSLVNNLEDLRKQAKDIPLTIEQITNVGKSFVAEFIDKLEKKTGVFTLVGKGILFMAENVEVFAGAILGLAIASIPKLITAMKELQLATAKNPWGLLIVGITTLGVTVISNWDSIKKYTYEGMLYVREKMAEFNVEMRELGVKAFSSWIGKKLFPAGVLEEEIKKLKIAKQSLADIQLEKKKYYTLENRPKKTSSPGGFKGVDPLTREKEKADAVEALNRKWHQGKVTLEDYSEKLRKINVEYSDLFSLTDKVNNGLEDGLKSYVKSVSNLSKSISNAITNSFEKMEDTLIDFVKTGKIQFKSLVDSIMSDLLRMTIQQTITAPLAGALSSSISGANSSGGGWGSISAHATGNSFSSGNVIPFAKGGAFSNSVVNTPTFFPMPGNKTGLMGEAGPEAIMPLTRIGGSLGVKSVGGGSNVQVNVINNAGVEIETRESQSGDSRVIEVLINKTVKNSISTGAFDKEMNNSFGVNRVGSA